MSEKADKKAPYLTNNIIIPKKDQEGPMFLGHTDENGESHLDCYLDSYAIIPREVFEDLLDAVGLNMDDFLAFKDSKEAQA